MSGGNPHSSPPDGVGAAELYDVYRSQIEHEDELIGLRGGWFIAAEAFLFSAYGVVLAVQKSTALDGRVLDVMPLLGIAFSLIVGLGIGAALHQGECLYLLYEKHAQGNLQRPNTYPGLRPPFRVGYLGHIPAMLLTPTVILAWAYVWHGSMFCVASAGVVLLLIAAAFPLHFWLLERARNDEKLTFRKFSSIAAVRKRHPAKRQVAPLDC